MKQVFACFVLLAIVVTMFAGCQEPYDPNKLYTDIPSQEVCKEMYLLLLDMGEQVDGVDYSNFHSDFTWYYGTINGCIVAFGVPGQIDATRYITVAGCTFRYGSSFKIFVYRDGEACELEEAYEQEWLTEEHIQKLEVRHVELMEERHKAIEEAFQKRQESQDG